MGATQSYLSAEVVVTASAFAGAVALAAYTQHARAQSESPPSPAQKPGKKGKKKKTAAAAAPSAGPAAIPGGFDADAPETPKPEPAASSKPKPAAASKLESPAAPKSETPVAPKAKKPKKKKAKEHEPAPQAVSHEKASSDDTDGSWTRVKPRRAAHPVDAAAGPSNADASVSTGTGTGTEDDDEEQTPPARAPDNVRTLAEKLVPKPRKTKVDDMLPQTGPALARVMRVQPRPDEKPAGGLSWGDYEDVEERAADGGDEDDGWGVVKGKGSRKLNAPTTGAQTASPAKAASSSTETLTKRQRQNAAKRDAARSAKAEADAVQAALLAQHKRELERERMKAQQSGGRSKLTSGGSTATVDGNGKLVWD
ncbi:hypothetical protein PLICRDRAFT_55089 [Plicaturopsis crispa FD-325 SS-3]|nr:hypothetical protein PLICRDRAFT_55089 [Plicaturopsis crispa FD-325 SS-3]